MVSPYATLQLPAALAAQQQGGQSQNSPSADIAAQLNKTLDQVSILHVLFKYTNF
jgi:hypothetical protein